MSRFNRYCVRVLPTILLTLALLAPSHADTLDQIEHQLELQQFARAAQTAAAYRGSPAAEFHARSLQIRALLGERRLSLAWRLLRQLEKSERAHFPKTDSFDFYLVRGQLLARRHEQAARQNFEEAEGGPRPAQLACERARLETTFWHFEEAQRLLQAAARTHSPPFWSGELQLAQARLLVAEGLPEQAWLPLAAAENSFRQAQSAAGLTRVELLRAGLEVKEGSVQGAAQRLMRVLARLHPKETWARMEILDRLATDATKKDAPAIAAQLDLLYHDSSDQSIQAAVLHRLTAESYSSEVFRKMMAVLLNQSEDPWDRLQRLDAQEDIATVAGNYPEAEKLRVDLLELSKRLQPEPEDPLVGSLCVARNYISLARMPAAAICTRLRWLLITPAWATMWLNSKSPGGDVLSAISKFPRAS